MKNEIITKEFKIWVKDLSIKYKKSQIKAAMKVNSEMLSFYYELGKEISLTSYKAKYGSKFYDNLSKELIDNLPDITGLSPINLRYMERFFLLYEETIRIVPQLVEKLFSIPWGHHRYIIDKCKDVNKALFYIEQTYENNWSRDVLNNFLDTNLYEREGKAINNFEIELPKLESDLAKQVVKDPYNFDFLTIRKDYDEKELKEKIVENIQKFLLELGNGFAFVGKEYRLLVGDTELYTDLLLYNIRIHAYVVVEVKNRKFKPGDLGQLGCYVSSVNHILKGEGDNDTIGLLICKDKDDVVAKYSLEGYNIPIGVSSFELSKFLPKDFSSSMPTIEEIENELKSN